MPESSRFDDLFRTAAAMQRLDWLLLKAQCMAESNLDPKAVSAAGAQGIAQFMPATWAEWGASGDSLNPEHAIPAQARYMAWLLRRYQNDIPKALAGYNWGAGNLRKHLAVYGQLRRDKLPAETKEYIERIERLRRSLQQQTATAVAQPEPKGEEAMNETPTPQAQTPSSDEAALPPKHVSDSKTLWINGIAALLALGLSLLGVPIPTEVVVTTLATTLTNIVLRFTTSQPVTFSRPEAQ